MERKDERHGSEKANTLKDVIITKTGYAREVQTQPTRDATVQDILITKPRKRVHINKTHAGFSECIAGILMLGNGSSVEGRFCSGISRSVVSMRKKVVPLE